MNGAFSIVIVLSLLGLTAGVTLAQPSTDPAEPQDGCSYFDESGHNLCGVFEAYWNANGGLPIFGYPITEAAPEANLDTGETYDTQYFERERLEHHPANAGTPYEVLLGRLGNEVLLASGRNWFEFPQSSPGDAHYFAETGHAIAPEFYDYWSSNGLEFGDEGVSFRESLALFGYPISPAQMETNPDGDTVLTQWFERARFEHHPDNPEGQQVLLGRLGAELLAFQQEPPLPEPPGEVIAEGLDNPRHLTAGPDRAVYVAEAGAGGDECITPDPEDPEFQVCVGGTSAVTRIENGEQARVVSGLPSWADPSGAFALGAHDVEVSANGQLHVVLGAVLPAPFRDAVLPESGALLGHLVTAGQDGSFTSVTDLAAWEQANNPDGMSDFGELGADSNPYGLALLDDGSYLVTDAGGNSLLHVEADGTVEVIAVFEPRMVALPPEFVEEGVPGEIPMHPVPTSVTVGPDGAYYVSELTGFPFPVGAARIYRVTPEGEVSVHAEGFTNIIDLAFDDAGNLYVVEITRDGLLPAEMPGAPLSAFTGALVMVTPDGTQTEIASEGLVAPGGVAVGDDGTIYVSNYSVFPDMGQVLAIDGQGPPAGEVVASGLNSPRGMTFTGDGSLLIAEAGVGGDECFEVEGPEGPDTQCYGPSGAITSVVDGDQSHVVSGLQSFIFGSEGLGPQDVVAGPDGLYVIMGLGGDPATSRDALGDLTDDLGWLLHVAPDGAVTKLVDVAAWEAANNPDGSLIDSNPFSLVRTDDGGFVVSDAGANALLTISPEGEIAALAVFPERMVDATDLPIPELPPEIPMEAVPTGLTVGPDGAYYVGELTGFPFEPGAARIWRVTPDGEAEVYAEGFTNIIDLAFDSAGNLYVLEIATNGLLSFFIAPEDPAGLAGGLHRIAPDGTRTRLDDGNLVLSTGLAIGPDDSIYVAHYGLMPEAGEVIRIPGS